MIVWILSDSGVWLQLTERVNRQEAEEYLAYYQQWFPGEKFSIRKI